MDYSNLAKEEKRLYLLANTIGKLAELLEVKPDDMIGILLACAACEMIDSKQSEVVYRDPTGIVAKLTIHVAPQEKSDSSTFNKPRLKKQKTVS
jgi:hypothetical protein